jgi:RimJ/RimL family protein N-acetyltransferase
VLARTADVIRDNPNSPVVRIEPWGRGDLALLESVVGDPAMMEHLGGAESAEKIAERQRRYEQPDSRQFKIVEQASGHGVGWVGYWEREWRGEGVYEIGWAVLPASQRRGVGVASARQAIDAASSEAGRRFIHAFPAPDNVPSNAICRRLGFALLGPCELEYPAGSSMRCSDWRLDLLAGR